MRSLLALAVALVFSCAPPDCASGSDTSVSGTWTVEGEAPTSTSCADVGIDTVRLGIYCGGNVAYLSRLEAPCTAGGLDSLTGVLRAGTYDVAWEGFRDGVRVAMGDRHPLTATAGTRAVVPVVDFVTGYDPRGSDASLSARWTIDGVAPTSTSCIALGISRVRVAAFHGSRAIELAQLTATCNAGGIDTRPIAVLAGGDVTLQLQALDAHQVVVFSGAMVTLHVGAGPTHVALYDGVPVDFTSGTFDPHGGDASVGFSWTLDRQMASIDACDAVDAATANLVLYAADDTTRAHGVSVAQAPCHLGSFASSSAIVRAGAYVASIEARSAMGAVLTSTSPTTTPFAVQAGVPFDVPSVDLAFPTTLAVTFDWTNPVGGAATTCAGAGVTTMSYTLTERASGVVVAQQTGVPCAQRLSFDGVRTPGFGGGSYDLVITGTSGSRNWRTSATECTQIDVAASSIVWDTCLVSLP